MGSGGYMYNRRKEIFNYFAPKERGKKKSWILLARKFLWASFVKTIFHPCSLSFLCSSIYQCPGLSFETSCPWFSKVCLLIQDVMRGICSCCLALQAIWHGDTSFHGIFSFHLWLSVSLGADVPLAFPRTLRSGLSSPAHPWAMLHNYRNRLIISVIEDQS